MVRSRRISTEDVRETENTRHGELARETRKSDRRSESDKRHEKFTNNTKMFEDKETRDSAENEKHIQDLIQQYRMEKEKFLKGMAWRKELLEERDKLETDISKRIQGMRNIYGSNRTLESQVQIMQLLIEEIPDVVVDVEEDKSHLERFLSNLQRIATLTRPAISYRDSTKITSPDSSYN